MSRLEKNQQEFIEKLFDHGAYPAGIQSRHPAERFQVYRLTVFETYRQALALTFPYVWQRLSDAEAISIDEIAGRFILQRDNLPMSGCLDDWGGAFPAFLITIPELAKPNVWAELAQYEWLCHQASLVPVRPALTAADLVALSEEEQMASCFRFQPSFCLHYAPFPLGDFVEHLSKTGAHWLVISRLTHQVMTYEISEDWAFFFKKLWNGLSITRAYEEISVLYSGFNLTQALTFLLSSSICEKSAVK